VAAETAGMFRMLAQLMLAMQIQASFIEVKDFNESQRGSYGLGSNEAD
jgi:hypothetical protein